MTDETESKTPEQILVDFENDVTSHRPHERVKVVSQAITLFETQGRAEKAARAKWEAMLLSLHRRQLGEEESLGGRFGVAMQLGDRRSPDISDFGDDACVYFEERLKTSQNPILRSWYADFLWERKRNHIFAREAIRAYRECYPICIKNEWWQEAADNLVRALRLAARLNDRQLVEAVKQELLAGIDYLSNTRKHPQVRWCLDMLDALLALKLTLVDSDLERAISVCHVGTEVYLSKEAGPNHHIARGFVDREASALQKVGKDEAAKAARLRIGQLLEDEAEMKGGTSNLVGVHFLEDAARHYANIGQSGKVEELKVRIRERYEAAVQQGEFKKVSAEVKIPMKEVEESARALLKDGLDKALLVVSVDESLLPDIDQARSRTQKLKTELPLQGIIPRSIIRGTRLVKQASTQEQIDEANALSWYSQDAGLRGIFLTHTFDVFEKEGGLDAGSLTKHLANSPFFDKEVLTMVKVGVERYFAGDYVSSIHVLVPKLEESLRRMIGKLGVATTSRDSATGAMREKPLDEVLKTPELDKLLGGKRRFYLEHVLVSQQGDNLRNDVAHGLITAEQCTRELTHRVLHMYLMLTPVVSQNQPDESPQPPSNTC